MNKSFEELVIKSSEETRVLNSKMKQVAGRGGILRRINERHLIALNKLLESPEDKTAIRRVKAILEREERITLICLQGLSKYDKTLKALESKGKRFFKKGLVNDIRFIREVVKGFENGLNRIWRRLNGERWSIEKKGPKEIRRLIAEIEGETRDFERIIRGSNVGRLGSIRTGLVGYANSGSIKILRDLFTDECLGTDISGRVDPVGVFAQVGMGIFASCLLVPASIIESLFNVMNGFTIEDSELRTEISKLKKAA